MIIITPFYAAILGLVFIALSRNTIMARRKAKILLGDGGDALLLQYIRAHGNFSEYVPLALLLIAFAEVQGAPALLVHGLGSLLVFSRIVHAFGISKRLKQVKFRVIGVVSTFITIIASSIINIILSIGAMVVA